MKRKTYSFIKHIPLIGSIVEIFTCVPALHSNYIKSDEKFNKEYIEPFIEYLKIHPDVQPTRQLLYKFLEERNIEKDD